MGLFSGLVKTIKSVAKPALSAAKSVLGSKVTAAVSSFIPGGSATLKVLKWGAAAAGAAFGASSTAQAATGGRPVSALSTILKGASTLGTGAAIGSALSGGGSKRRRRRRKRLTASEYQELIMLKQVLGPRNPAMTIAAMKMLDRG